MTKKKKKISKIPGIPSEPIKIRRNDSKDAANYLAEAWRREIALYKHYGVAMHKDGAADELLRKVLADFVPGFQVEFINPLKNGAPNDFSGADLAALMCEIGLLMEAEKVDLTKNRRIKNVSAAIRLVAQSKYFQNRAIDWKLYKRHPKNKIDQEILFTKIHDVWRKDIMPVLEGKINKQSITPRKPQFTLQNGV